ARLLRAAFGDAVREAAQVRGELTIRFGVPLELLGARIDLALENRHSGASRRRRKQVAADQHSANFVRPGADLIKLRVAPQTPGRILVRVPVAAERLDRLACHPRSSF